MARLQSDAAFEAADGRPRAEADREAGVTRDVTARRLGAAHHKDWHRGVPLRVVVVENREARPGEPRSVLLVTDRPDWPAWMVALAYRYRCCVELFFPWLKSILGCRHLLSRSADGVAIQVYCALIASVLLGQWAGRKPGKRTFEMFCHFFGGLATEAELRDDLGRVKAAADAKAKKAESSA